jgi:spore protease
MSRTDLAVECVTEEIISEGITRRIRGENFKITEIEIENDECGQKIGKPKGHYVTLENSSLSLFSGDYNNMVHELSEEIGKFIPKGHIMVSGLGNDDITPDALGVYTAENIIATRHLKGEMQEDEFFRSLRPVSVLVSGVIGNTGIETMEIIKSVTDKIKPSAVIAVDALACADMSRLGTTIQISDSGICPGSGVQNKRKELSAKTLGVPVIAIGVPTVMDMYTIIENCTGKNADENIPNMLVTPKDIDKIINHCSMLISMGINLALQDNLSFEDIEELQR